MKKKDRKIQKGGNKAILLNVGSHPNIGLTPLKNDIPELRMRSQIAGISKVCDQNGYRVL